MKRIFVLLLMQLGALWCSALPLEVDGTLCIRGRVVDVGGDPLVGATVLLDGYMLGASTNTHGEFVLSRLNAGSYYVTVSYIGYERVSLQVSVPQSQELVVVMRPTAVMCDEVVVSATRASERMPIAQSRMDHEVLKQRNDAGSLPLMLELLPSVVATTESGALVGNSSMRIRGTDMTRINVTVNNIPLNDAESQGVIWVDLPDFQASVDNVQVQRGVGSSTNGSSAFGATVNFLTTSTMAEPFTNVEAVYGSFNTLKASVRMGSGLVNHRFSFEGRFSHLRSDGYIERGGSNHRSMFLTGAWHGEKSLVRFNLIHGEEITDITWEGTPSTMLGTNRRYNPAGEYIDQNGRICYYPEQKDNYKQTHYQLIASHTFGNDLFLNLALHATKGLGHYEEYKVGKRFSDYGLQPIVVFVDSVSKTIKRSDFVVRKMMDNVFYGAVGSLRYNVGTVDATLGGGWNRYNGQHFGRMLWSAENQGIQSGYEWYRNRGLKTDWNCYAKLIWQPVDLLSFYADLQYRGIAYDLRGIDSDVEHLDQEHRWDFVNPKVGASVNINAQNVVYLSVSVANREPTRADLKDAQKGVVKFTPKPERLFDFELGYSLRHTILALQANLYYMHYRDQLVLTGELSDVGYALMTNVPRSYRAGCELIMGLKPLPWFRWDANLTLSRNKILNFVEYVDVYDDPENWKPLPQEVNSLGTTTIAFSPAVVGASILSVNVFKSVDLQWISKYVGKQFIDNTQNSSRMLSAYWVNNFKIDYRFKLKGTKSIVVQAIINNFLNAKYESNAWVYRAKFLSDGSEYREDGYFPQAGINFALRVGLDF